MGHQCQKIQKKFILTLQFFFFNLYLLETEVVFRSQKPTKMEIIKV